VISVVKSDLRLVTRHSSLFTINGLAGAPTAL
jgi:hypothetical protein